MPINREFSQRRSWFLDDHKGSKFRGPNHALALALALEFVEGIESKGAVHDEKKRTSASGINTFTTCSA